MSGERVVALKKRGVTIPTGPTRDAMARLRRQAAFIVELADAVLLGGVTNQHDALPLLPAALATLQTRTKQALVTLERDRQRGGV